MVAFYKHNIPDWMDGTEALSDGAYRAYHVICQLIYLNEGPIALNERGIAGRCNQSIKTFRKALDELVQAGKVAVADGIIRNGRAERELQSIRTNRENGKKGGEMSGKSRQNSGKPGEISENLRQKSDQQHINSDDQRNDASKALKNNEAPQAPLQEDRSLREKRREEETREESIDARTREGGDPPTASRVHANELVERLVEAAASNVESGATGIEIVKPILDLMAMGCDLDLDVLPVIRDRVPRMSSRLRTWNAQWLREAILEHRTKRLDARPMSPQATQDDREAIWGRKLTSYFGPDRLWPGSWGNTPDEPRCQIPKEFIDRWKAANLPPEGSA